jgi:hypothetical protein
MASANFSDLLKAAEDAGFSNCPPGTYDVRIVEGVAKTTSAGKDMIVVKFEIVGGPHGGRKVPNNFVISPENANALGFFFRHMRAMGLDGAYFSQNPAPQKVAADLVGQTCRIEVGTRVWNGEEREDVKKIMPPLTEAGPAPAAPAVATATTPAAPAPTADPMAPHVPF